MPCPWVHHHITTLKRRSQGDKCRLFSSPGPLDKLAMLNLLSDRTKAFSHLWTPSSGRRKATSQKGTRIIAIVERVRNLHKLGPKPTLLLLIFIMGPLLKGHRAVDWSLKKNDSFWGTIGGRENQNYQRTAGNLEIDLIHFQDTNTRKRNNITKHDERNGRLHWFLLTFFISVLFQHIGDSFFLFGDLRTPASRSTKLGYKNWMVYIRYLTLSRPISSRK